MARINDVKRHLLREAVLENTGVRQDSVSLRLRSRRRWSWLRRMLSIGLPVIFLTLSYVMPVIPIKHSLLTSVVAFLPEALRTILTPWVRQSDRAPELVLPPPLPLDLRVFPLGVAKIVIDPGHGGMDGGAVTPSGLVEKELTLDIGHRLRRLLEQASFQVLMTREKDESVSLVERATLANTAEADLFVSVHVNSFETFSVRGPETYYLGPSDDPHVIGLAEFENRDSGYSLGDFRKLLENVYLDVRRAQSRRLARTVQRQLDSSLRTLNADLVNRGVKMAPFLVLVATKMPAILTEVSYLSNQEEAHLLATTEYRQHIAQALFQGIQAYARTLNLSQKKGS